MPMFDEFELTSSHLRCLLPSIAASSCNMYAKTFTGIDGAGRRLADEVSSFGYGLVHIPLILVCLGL